MRLPFTIKNKTALLFWMVRWLLLLLLLFVLGSILEGPPTRVVVRSMPFILACYLLAILTGQFLHQVYRLHLAQVTIPALIIPAGYVHFAQAYYHGGKNEQFKQHIAVFFILMCLVGVVYLYSLFVINPKKAQTADEEFAEYDFGFEVTLYNLDSEGKRGSVKLKEQGENDLPDYITIDGFSKDIVIDLDEHWDAYLDDDDLVEYSTNITTYETIVKFGEPMQLDNKYQLVLKLN